MCKRGGGVVDLRWRLLAEDMIVVELLVDVREAMGANAVNTIAEATAPFINELLGQGAIGIRILSNLCTDRMTIAQFEIPVEKLAWKGAAVSQGKLTSLWCEDSFSLLICVEMWIRGYL